ncbi:MAG: hypothetical protein AAFR61_14210 [Bacteroidota bacterium]
MEDRDYQLIMQYRQGRLSPAEREVVEKRLAEDESFAKLLAQDQAADQWMEAAYEADLKAEVGEMLAEMAPPSKPAPIQTLSPWMWGVAASVLLLVGLGIWYGMRPPEEERLFAEYYEPYLIGGPKRTLSMNEVDSLFMRGWDVYERGEYEKAAKWFDQIPEAYPAYVRIQLYKGISYLGASQYQEAEGIFDALMAEEETGFKEVAQWYKALSILRRNDRIQARKLFEQIASEETSPYKEKAKKVANLLNE